MTSFHSEIISEMENSKWRETDSTVVANACSFPAAVIATWVTLIQLKAVVLVPANVKDWHTKRPLAWITINNSSQKS